MVGYNRRYSPLAQIMKDAIGPGPLAMMYRINAGEIPRDSWIHDEELGGGRIIGEVCHFIDFLTFLNESLPIRVHAVAMRTPDSFEDVLTITLSYQNGSIGSISYFSNGDKSLPKEYVEVHSKGISVLLNDFKTIKIFSKGKSRSKKLATQNKGQQFEIDRFIKAIVNNKGYLIPYEEIYSASMVTFKIIESIRNNAPMNLDSYPIHN